MKNQMTSTLIAEALVPSAPDNGYIALGTDSPAELGWCTIDANANCLMLDLPAGGAVDVPVLVAGIDIKGRDLAFFNGKTFPLLAVADNDRDSWVALGFNADDDARIVLGGLAALTLPAVTIGGAISMGTGTAPAGTVVYAVNDNTGDLTLSCLTGKTINMAEAGVDVAQFGAATLAFQQATTISTTTGALTLLTNASVVNVDGGEGLCATRTDNAAYIQLRNNKASPPADTACGFFSFLAKDSAGNYENYAQILGYIADPTNGTEDGYIMFKTMVAGVNTQVGKWTGSGLLLAQGFGMAGVGPAAQQAHVADPTDLATCITAITAINAMCAAFGLTAAA